MSTWLFKGYDKPELRYAGDGKYEETGQVIKYKIPRKAHYRIESLPGRRLVAEGTTSGQVAADLDPGKYVCVITKFTDTHEDDQSWEYEFMHEMTEEQWRHIQSLKPKIFRTINTTEGPRMRCQFLGCDYECSHPMAAVIHEAEHWGVDLLSHPGTEMREVLHQKSSAYLQDRKAAELTKRIQDSKE